MSKFSHLSDPRWREISASLRRGLLYVKMPVSKAVLLNSALSSSIARAPSVPSVGRIKEMLSFLRSQVGDSACSSTPVVFRLESPTATEDLNALRQLEQEFEIPHPVLSLYCRALEKGLQGDSEVDWLLRVGGPIDEPSIQPASIPTDPEVLDLID